MSATAASDFLHCIVLFCLDIAEIEEVFPPAKDDLIGM